MRTRARIPVLLAAICAAAAPGPSSAGAQKQGLVHDRESGRAVAGLRCGGSWKGVWPPAGCWSYRAAPLS